MILLYEVPRVVTFLETESRRCLLGTKRREEWELLSSGCGVAVWEDEKSSGHA